DGVAREDALHREVRMRLDGEFREDGERENDNEQLPQAPDRGGSGEPVLAHRRLLARASGRSAQKNMAMVSAAVVVSAATMVHGASPCVSPFPSLKNAR